MLFFDPLNTSTYAKKLNRVIIIAGSLIIILQSLALVQPNHTVWLISQAFGVTILLVCFATLVASYASTGRKLYVQGRAVRPQNVKRISAVDLNNYSGTAADTAAAATTAETTAQERRTRTEQQPGKKRAMHIQALKIYTSILFAFFVANLAAAAVALFDMKWMMYVCYVNYTANPLIYYCFVEKFRNSVKEYWRRLIAR